MATWFYAMHRALRLKAPLLATVHQAQFLELDLTFNAQQAVHDIHNSKFWKAIYNLLRTVFPTLKALHTCDSNTPAMDKIFYLCHCTSEAITKSLESMNDEELFGPLAEEDISEMKEYENQVFFDGKEKKLRLRRKSK